MINSQECIRSIIYFRLDSGDAGGDNGFRAECDLGVGYTSIRKECCWVQMSSYYQVKPRGSLARLNARLVAKGYSQVYVLDYVDTFSPVTKMIFVRIMVSLAVTYHMLSLALTYHWLLHPLNIKNVFLNSILDDEIYMEQPPGIVAQRDMRKRFTS